MTENKNQAIEPLRKLNGEESVSNDLSALAVSEDGKLEMPVEIKVSSFELFDDRSSYINGSRVYYAYFETIPNMKMIANVRFNEAIKWVEKELSVQILKKHVREDYSTYSRKMEIMSAIFILRNQLMVKFEFENNTTCVYYGEDAEQEAQNISNGLQRFVRKSSDSYVNLIVHEEYGLDLRPVINKKVKLVLEENYNDTLLPVHKHIVKELKAKNKSGLVLFHGKPGTGKSTYLRFLIHLLKQKSVIFLSPKLARNLDSPELTKLLLQHTNSVLIIEDAEELLMSRSIGNDSNISMLLNLTDGILGESLGTQVVCTFNTLLTNIDKALLRKGRLIALYEFDALTKEKAQKLSDSLGYKTSIESDMTLAEIFHQEEQDYSSKPVQKIGFNIN